QRPPSSIACTCASWRVMLASSIRSERSGRTRSPTRISPTRSKGAVPKRRSSAISSPLRFTCGRGRSDTESEVNLTGRPTAWEAVWATKASTVGAWRRRENSQRAPHARSKSRAIPPRSQRSDRPVIGPRRKRERPAPWTVTRTARASAGRSRLLRNEQDLAGGLPPLQRLVGLRGLGERELVLDAKLHLAVANPAQHVVGPLDQLLAGRDVVVEARPLQEERALHVERLQIEGRHRPARRSEQDHVAARAEAAQALVEGAGPHAVVHHV